MIGNYNNMTKAEEASKLEALEELTAVDIMQEVLKRKLTGVMFHDDMQTCMDYLNFHGFKREQEYRTLEEMAEFKSLERYLINHYDVMPDKHTERVEVNPLNIKSSKSRMVITVDQKKQALKSLFDSWLRWESETITMLESFATHLAKHEHNVDAKKVKSLLVDTTNEYKYIERRVIEYNNVEWSMHHIYCEQDRMHKHYDEKTKETYKIDLC